MNISIVIPNFNGEHLLRKNLPNVIATAENYSKGNVEIIIVDDCSLDNSSLVIKDFMEKVSSEKTFMKLLKNEKNLGFASTVNKGVNNANGEIIVLLNTDVIPEKDIFEKAVRHFSDETVFAVGFKDESEEKGNIIYRGRGIGKWYRGFLIHSRGAINKSNTLWASGGSCAFRKTHWDKIGGLYEVYNPFYWEDIDVSYRALKAGYTIYFDQACMVKHEHDEGSIRTQYSQFTIRSISYRNQFFFVWINASDPKILMSHFLWMPFHFVNAAFRADAAFYSGFFKALAKVLSVIKLRLLTQKLCLRTDKHVIKEFVV